LFFLKIIIWTISNWKFLAYSQVKRHEKIFFSILCLIKSFFSFNNIFINKFSISFSPICIQFLFNWILVHSLNWIQISFYVFELNLINFKFNWSCTQCHSLFSYEWNLISTKSIHFFINWSPLIVYNNVEH